MRFHDILTKSTPQPGGLALVTWDDQATWCQLCTAIDAAKQWIAPMAGQRVGFLFSPSVGGFATLAALDFHGCDTCLLGEQLHPETADAIADELGLNTLIAGSQHTDPLGGTVKTFSNDVVPAQPGITILTSGTEGTPKAARHSWESLARPIRVRDDASGSIWLLAFRPHLYAGLQVILQCMANRGCLVIPRFRTDVPDVVRMVREHQVQCVSATPSFWRRLLLFSEMEQWQGSVIRQITLGGEIVDQQILDELRSRFPTARIVHIFATTELGRCFTVTDGKAGFPVELLDHPTSDGIELKIQDGQLWVKSANAMQRYRSSSDQEPIATGWWCTGDLVEQTGDRVVFLGRAGDTINVGGNKVQPTQIENIIRQVPGVANVQVYGIPSSITGQLVGCRIVRSRDATEETVRASISLATSALDTFQRPRICEFVDEIEITDAGKTARRK